MLQFDTSGPSFWMLCWGCFCHTSLWWVPWNVSIKYQSQVPRWCWNVPWLVCAHNEALLSYYRCYILCLISLLLSGRALLFPVHFNGMLRWYNSITICSVDIAGRREMRDLFNGIVRLQVFAAVRSIFLILCDNSFLVLCFSTCSTGSDFYLRVFMCQPQYLHFADVVKIQIQGSGRSLPRSCTSRMDKTSVRRQPSYYMWQMLCLQTFF